MLEKLQALEEKYDKLTAMMGQEDVLNDPANCRNAPKRRLIWRI